jgi:hypothetical protein
MPPVLLRVLATGKAGSAEVGGALDGREGLGSVVVVVDMVASRSLSRLGLLVGYRVELYPVWSINERNRKS